ncbi:MAG: 16S rRNA (cytosine(1402)-N(4))-methyltransferase RsmH [Phycisphaerales bacterium]|nr:MAG: 16S rRNA (cytosine(1402)-N(4))-methyltransferase RsmH [Phycisphaerales bacterium]
MAGQVRLPVDGVMVDVTVGHGGHSLLFGKTLGPAGIIVGFDLDTNVIRRARIRLENLACKVILIHSNFAEISDQVGKLGIKQVDFILADLGMCSAQILDAEKGLSFQSNMPLDMRIDKRIKRTAADIINSADEKALADLIYRFGQDRASRRIARFIATRRRRGRIETTGELAAVVCKALGRPGGRRSRIHPATRTFQALRIAVNDELGNLEKLLISAPSLLKRNGQLAVISFHSLEDRLVKKNFRENEKANVYRIITRKPIVASREEVLQNRRSRSAKLRIAQRR